MHSPPSSDCRSGSSLAAHRRASTGREVFIAPLAAYGKLQVPSCHPYEVRARGSERSRRVRFGTGPGSLEKVAVFGSRFLKTWASLPGRKSRGSGFAGREGLSGSSETRCRAGQDLSDSGARGGCQGESPDDRLDPPLNLQPALQTSAWSSVKKSMKTRSAMGQTGKAPSNPIN